MYNVYIKLSCIHNLYKLFSTGSWLICREPIPGYQECARGPQGSIIQIRDTSVPRGKSHGTGAWEVLFKWCFCFSSSQMFINIFFSEAVCKCFIFLVQLFQPFEIDAVAVANVESEQCLLPSTFTHTQYTYTHTQGYVQVLI